MRHEHQTIPGQPPSKSNCHTIHRLPGGGATIGKTDAVYDYERNFFMRCSLRGRMITRRFRLSIDVYFRTDSSDLDNSLKVVLDCLQSVKAIKNDNKCVEIHARKFIDKENPRVEFDIEELI